MLTRHSGSKELEARDKQETATEGTRPGPTFRPDVDILEREDSFVIFADLPGVTEKELDIRLDKGVLTLEAGLAEAWEKESTPLHQEYQPGSYYRQFRVSDKIDSGGVHGKMKDGVLELVLPKTAAHQARHIPVEAA